MTTQETFESVLLQVRKALCGDIHNQDDIVEMAAGIIEQRDELLAALKWIDAFGFDAPELRARARMAIASVKEKQNGSY